MDKTDDWAGHRITINGRRATVVVNSSQTITHGRWHSRIRDFFRGFPGRTNVAKATAFIAKSVNPYPRGSSTGARRAIGGAYTHAAGRASAWTLAHPWPLTTTHPATLTATIRHALGIIHPNRRGMGEGRAHAWVHAHGAIPHFGPLPYLPTGVSQL